jgi:hypothetical protein
MLTETEKNLKDGQSLKEQIRIFESLVESQTPRVAFRS